MSVKNERELINEIAAEVLDLPPEGQWLVDLDGASPFLLSFSSSVGEKDHFKIWIQGEAAIKVGWNGPSEPFSQLIFRGNFASDNKIKLIERHGYQGINHGEELEFLALLMAEGEWEPWSLKP